MARRHAKILNFTDTHHPDSEKSQTNNTDYAPNTVKKSGLF